MLDQTNVQLEVPLACLRTDEMTLRKAFSQLLANRKAIRILLPELLSHQDQVKAGWPKWMRIAKNWLLQVYQYPAFGDAPINDLMDELLL